MYWSFFLQTELDAYSKSFQKFKKINLHGQGYWFVIYTHILQLIVDVSIKI